MKTDTSLDDLLKEVTEAIGDIGDQTRGESRGRQAPEITDNLGASAFPTEMSCSQVFDQLLKCYSIGGQMRHYYRYGEISYCQDKRSKLKFCLGTKLMSAEQRKQRIAEWHMEQLAGQIARGQTSEEVWSPRSEPLRLPFREDSEQVLKDTKSVN